ncbi:hypothetical protein ACF0H5_021000 [Mactra antiquata]
MVQKPSKSMVWEQQRAFYKRGMTCQIELLPDWIENVCIQISGVTTSNTFQEKRSKDPDWNLKNRQRNQRNQIGTKRIDKETKEIKMRNKRIVQSS